MTCKCGARTYEEHLKKAEEGYPGHLFDLQVRGPMKKLER